MTENDAIIAYGAEGLRNAGNELYIVNNTLVNDLPAGGRFIFVMGDAGTVRIVNNVFSGPGELLSGRGTLENNVRAERSDFVDPARFDYRLADGAAAIDRGIDPGEASGVSLRPLAEYLHRVGRRTRIIPGTPDLGAFEYRRGRPSP